MIRKVGSGRVPVSSRSGKAVMKITGTENSARMSLTASMPRTVVGQLDVGEHQARRRLARLRDRLVAGDGDAGDIVAEIANDRLDIHRDDRLVLDDQHVGVGLALDLGQRLGDQAVDVVRRRADQIARVLGRKALQAVSSSAWRDSGVIRDSRAWAMPSAPPNPMLAGSSPSSILARRPDGVEGPVEAEPRIDVARKFIGRGDDRFQRRADEGVAMRLAAGQGARVAAKEGQMRREFLAKRHIQ